MHSLPSHPSLPYPIVCPCFPWFPSLCPLLLPPWGWKVGQHHLRVILPLHTGVCIHHTFCLGALTNDTAHFEVRPSNLSKKFRWVLFFATVANRNTHWTDGNVLSIVKIDPECPLLASGQVQEGWEVQGGRNSDGSPKRRSSRLQGLNRHSV